MGIQKYYARLMKGSITWEAFNNGIAQRDFLIETNAGCRVRRSVGAHSREVLEDLKQALNQTQIERHIENIHADEIIYVQRAQGPLTHSIGRILESHCYAAYPHSIPRLSDSFSGYIV